MEDSPTSTRKMTFNSMPVDLIEEIDKFVNWRRKNGKPTSRERVVIEALNQVFRPVPRFDITDFGEDL